MFYTEFIKTLLCCLSYNGKSTSSKKSREIFFEYIKTLEVIKNIHLYILQGTMSFILRIVWVGRNIKSQLV